MATSLPTLVYDYVVNGAFQSAITVPPGYKYLFIENPTAYNVNIYNDLVQLDVNHRVAFCSIYTILPVLLNEPEGSFAQLMFVASGTGQDKIRVSLHQDNPGTGQSLITPGGSSSVIIAADGVGLAKSAQLPAALSADGYLAVDLAEDNLSLLKSTQLNIDSSKNLGVNIENSIPAGTNPIGTVHLDQAIPSGTNQIGHVIIDSPTNAQAITTGIVGGSQQTIGVVAVQVTIPSNIKKLAIKNTDTINLLYLGKDNTVTTSNGFPIDPKGVYSEDVIPGSTITVWAIASTPLTIAVLGVA